MNGSLSQRIRQTAVCLLLALGLGACAPTPERPERGHVDGGAAAPADIPEPVRRMPVLEPPKPRAPEALYTVVVTDAEVRELLFALARDAKVNVDVHPEVSGRVTLNAVDQTLPQILDRIARQVDVRFIRHGDTLIVEPDAPYLHTYRIDYVNMARDNQSTVSVATQIATTGASAVGDSGGEAGNNNSTTTVVSTSNQRFWNTLVANVEAILGAGEVADSGDSGAAAAAAPAEAGDASADASAASTSSGDGEESVVRQVFASPEAGLLTVRATSRQHREIQAYLDTLLNSAQRQVLIEATVVEVRLNDDYQLGVDWNVIANNAGWGIDQSLIGTTFSQEPFTLLTYADPSTRRGDVSATLGMLRRFGDVKVLSSPKIMAINNQTALLKVVDNLVYFTVEADTTSGDGFATTTFTSTVHTVPVGFVMSVTPQISETETVILNVRPTISRVTGFINDPNPSLAPFNIESRVPQIQVREMDSILRVQSGQTAVLGGLIQDSVDLSKSGTPGLSELPGVGELFSMRDNRVSRTELVIFLRPRVIRNASLNQELADFRDYLPAAQPVSGDPERLTPPPRFGGDGS